MGTPLIWHENIESFLQASLEDLKRDEALNNLILGLCLRIQENPDYYPDVKMVTVREGAQLSLAALITVPERPILYGGGERQNQSAAAFAEALFARGIGVPGVIGSRGLASFFSSHWRGLVDCDVELDMDLRVYKLTRVNAKVIKAGELRPARAGDLPFLTEGIARFEQEADVLDAVDWEQCVRRARRLLVEGTAYIWEVAGKPVSMAAKSRPTPNGITITLVYTPRALRGRGYATSCVAALSERLLLSGYKFCTLFADLSNPTANSIYRRVGFRQIGEFASFRFSYDK